MLKPLLKSVVKALAQTRGNIAVNFAVAAVPLTMVTGLSIDYAAINRQKTTLQAAADAAAIAAAQEISVANTDAAMLSNVALMVVKRQLEDLQGNLDVKTTLNKGANSITVTLSNKWTPIFSHLFFDGVTPITRAATATSVGTGSLCMIGLNPKENKTIHMTQGARLEAPGCGVYANSVSKHAISIENDARMKTAMTCSVGGVRLKKKSAAEPDIITDCPEIKDPLANRPAPPVGACDYNKTVIKNDIRTLSPGVYCGGLRIAGNSQVKLTPGVYVIKDGQLEVTDTSVLSGTNVGIYLTGDKAKLTFRKQTTIDLIAPVDGPMAGILIFEQRGASKSERHKITSDNARQLLGTIYLPSGTIKIDSDAPVADKSAFTAIIAWRVEMNEGPTLHLNANYDATDVPVPTGLLQANVRLIN